MLKVYSNWNTKNREIKYSSDFLYLQTKHSWHLVDPSPWPLLASFGALALTFGLVMYMHGYYGGFLT